MLGLGAVDVLGNTLINEAGKIYTIYGSHRQLPVPGPEGSLPLVNRTVTGSGDFLVSTSGAPTSFGDNPDAVDIDGDGENDFVLLPGQKEKWFRFTTLGDGKAGDQIRLITPAGETRTVLVRGVDGRLVPTPPSGNFQVETGPVINIGAQAGDAAILELDLSAYLDRIDRLNTITKATLKVDYGGAAHTACAEPDTRLAGHQRHGVLRRRRRAGCRAVEDRRHGARHLSGERYQRGR